jgi:aminopeptidase C
MLVNLVNKYGVVPKNAFPESSSSEAALLMNKFLRTKVYCLTKKIIHMDFCFHLVTCLCARNFRIS